MKILSTLDLFSFALAEDRSQNDVTSESLEAVAGDLGLAQFKIVAKVGGLMSGTRWVQAAEDLGLLRITSIREESQTFDQGDELVSGHGKLRDILAVERTLLNGLQHLCAVATQTQRVCAKVNRAAQAFTRKPRIYHTRKTLPLFRDLQIQAVIAGGGHAHRRDLSSRILFKENHKYLLFRRGKSLRDYLLSLGERLPAALIEVETAEEALEAQSLGVKNLMLDNFSSGEVAAVLPKLRGDVIVEVSGGLSEENICEYVLEGVDRLSLGSLTHSVKALDLSLDWSIA